MALYNDDTFQLANPESEQPNPEQYVFKGTMGPEGQEQNYYERIGVNRGAPSQGQQGQNPNGYGIEQDFAFLDHAIKQLGYNPFAINPTGQALREFQDNESNLFSQAFGHTGMTPDSLTPEALKYWNEQKQQLIHNRAAELTTMVTQGKDMLSKVMDLYEKRKPNSEEVKIVTESLRQQLGREPSPVELQQGVLAFGREKQKGKLTINQLEPEQIKSIAEGVASGTITLDQLSKRGMMQADIIPHVKQIYPNFDFTKASANYKYMTNSNIIRSAGLAAAVVPRIEDLSQKVNKLQNLTDLPIMDKPINSIRKAIGDVPVADFESLRNAVIQEVNTALSGSSTASDYRIKLELENLGSERTPAQLKAAINNLMSAIQARQEASQMVLYPWDVVQGTKSMEQWKKEQQEASKMGMMGNKAINGVVKPTAEKTGSPAKKRFTVIGVK